MDKERQHRRVTSLPRAFLLSLAAACALVLYLLWNSYADTRRAAAITAENVATAVAREIASSRQRLQEGLQVFVESAAVIAALSHDEPGDRERMHWMLETYLRQHPDVAQLTLHDAAGNLRLVGRPSQPAPAAAGSTWFAPLIDGSGSDVIAEVIEPRDGLPPAVLLAARIVDAQGRMIGALVVQRHLAQMIESFDSLDIGPRGALVIRLTGSNRAMLRRPPITDGVGPPPLTPVANRVRAGERAGGAHYRGPDGRWRMYSFRVVDGLPLYVNAGLADDDYLAAWRRHAIAMTLAAAAVLGAFWLSMSRRVASEAKLAESEEIFRSLSQATPAMLWMSRLDGSAAFVNPAWLQFTGRTLEQELEVDWIDDVHPDDRAATIDAYARALASDQPSVIEYRKRRHDGAWRWVIDTGQIRHGADGPPLGFVGTQIDITERKLAETEMAERLKLQHQLATVAATVPGLIYTFRREAGGDGYFSYLSPLIESVLGKPAEELRRDSTPIFELIHPDDRERVHKGMRKAAMGRERWQDEYRVQHPRQGTLWVHARAVATVEADGSVSWHGFVHDITARKKAEEALRGSEVRFRSYIERAPISILVIGRDGLIRECNSMVGEVLGFPQESLRTQPFARLIDTQDGAVVNAAFAQLVATGYAMAEFRVRNSSGGSLWASARGSRLPDGDFLVYVLDITDRRMAEQALYESQQRYRALVERSPDAIYVSHDGIFQFLNPAAVSLFGAARATELIGRDALDFFAEHERPLIRERREQVARGESVPVIEQEIVRIDGTRRIVEVVVTPNVDGDAARHELQVILRDITERRAAELQLAQAQRMEAIGQLTGGLAHDFNNILGIILGSLDLLSLESLDDEARGLIASAQSAANRGAEVTRSLLAVARQRPVTARVVDVNVLISDMRSLIQQTAGRRIDTVLDLAAPRPTVSMDPGSFDSALLNMVLNARDAMPDGGCLTVRTGNRRVDASNAVPRLTEGDYLEIVLTDTGVGMAPEVVARAFDPFFSTKERGKGTGLGLAMVYGFARQCGGTALIDSSPGGGTRLHMMLPVATTTVCDPVRHEADGPPPARPGETLLLVDDEADLRAICAQWAESLGYSVTAVASPSEALRQLRATDFDALITDVVMPGSMDGVALATAVRERHPQTAVLLVSGYADGSIDQSALPWRLLEKPFRREQLARELRTAIDEMASPTRPSSQTSMPDAMG